MSCGEKIHQVERKWKRKWQKEQEEKEKEARGIPVENWPGVPVTKQEPAKVEG